MRRDDWLVAQLPVGMVEDDFFVRFVSIFQHVASSIMEGVDNIDNIIDITVTPEPMVRWLASWIGVDSVDASLPHTLQRQIVRTSTRMLAWRGTRHGLRQFLELISGGPVEIEDGGGVYAEGGAPQDPAWVRMRVTSTGWLPEPDFVTLVRDEVPAHVMMELWVGERRIWPTQIPEQASETDAERAIGDTDHSPFAPPDLPEPRHSSVLSEPDDVPDLMADADADVLGEPGDGDDPGAGEEKR